MTCHTVRKPYYRAIGEGAVVLYPEEFSRQIQLEKKLRCNLPSPDISDPPRDATPLPPRDGGAPTASSPPADRRATYSDEPVTAQEYAQDVLALAAAAFVIVLALVAYTLLGGQS